MTCTSCGAALDDGARFCSSCGHAVSTRGDERRVATVLFADVVGFTSLSEGTDPEQVKELIDSCFERLVVDIAEFGGRVDKIIGDAILALFGAPQAHEDDAERAVRAALRMQATMASFAADRGVSLQLRIGVNTGEVLVGSLRAGSEYTAMGDAVNVAQRLQTAAAPGAVLVGPATHAATRRAIDYRPVGPLAVKGRDEPIETWEARTPLLPPGYRPRRVHAPLIGREAELGALHHAMQAAVDRGRAQLVLLVGEAGVGKSRLAAEAAGLGAVEHGAAVLEGRCVPYGEANVWWPVAEALRQACGIEPDAPRPTATEAATAAVRAALGDDDEAVARVVEGLLFLMGYEGHLREIDGGSARDEAVRSVLAFIEGSAAVQPVVVVLSDLHWADAVVLDLLDALLERLSRSPVVVVATARQEVHERWKVPAGRHNLLVLNLDPLDRQAASVLLDALSESEVPAALRQVLLDRSGGNPFYLEELVALVASGATTAPGAPGELPDTLRGLVAARIDALDPGERSTLEDAAVWGRSGPVEALDQMALHMRGVTVTPLLQGLVHHEVLLVEGDRWSFRSDLIREVAYNTLTKADRARRHFGIASFLEATGPPCDEASDRAVDVIAFHYSATAELLAEVGGVDKVAPPDRVTAAALEWLGEAARRAQVAQVLPVAWQLFDQALALLADRPDDLARLPFLLGRCEAGAALREADSAAADVAEAARLAELHGDVAAQARVLLVRGDLELKTGELDRSLVTLGEAEARFREAGDDQGVAESLRYRGMAHIFRGAHTEAEACIGAALEAYRALDDQRGAAWALQNLAWISFIGGRASEAEERLTASADTFTALGDRGGLGWALGLLAFVRFQQGRLPEAEELGAQVLAEVRDRGDRWGQGMMLLLLASVRIWSGRAAAAQAPLDEAIDLFATIGDRQGEAQATMARGRCSVTLGRVAAGFAQLEEALDRFGDVQGGEFRGALASAAASAAAQVGDPGRALDLLASAPVAPGANGLGGTERLVAEGLALVQADRGDEAVAALRALMAATADEPSAYAASALVLALAATGATEEALVLEEEVAAGPRATYLDRATARMAAALARLAAGDAAGLDELGELIAVVDATDDVVAQAVARLAEAAALESTDAPTAGVARQAAEARLASLGLTAEGWRRAFAAVLGVELSGWAAGSPAGTA